MARQVVRYVKHTGKAPCWGCSRRLQQWYEGDRADPMPPRVQKARWERRRDNLGDAPPTAWPLCGEHKDKWEVHDLENKRIKL